MPQFAYQGARDDGRMETGALNAADSAAALVELKARGLTPISIVLQAEENRAATIRKVFAAAIPRRNRLDERAVLFRALSPLLNAGIRPERAVALAAQMVAQSVVKTNARQWVDDMRAGRTLAAAMARSPELIPPNVSHAIAAAETSGTLSQMVEKIAASTQAAQQARNRVVSALAYPVLLLLTMLGVLALLFTSVIPSLKPLFAEAGSALPWPAAILLALADFSDANGWIALWSTIAAIVSAALYVRSEEGRARLHRALWQSEVLAGLPAKAASAVLARDLGLLLSGGVTLSRALDSAIPAVANVHFREVLQGAKVAIRSGKSLKSALAVIPGVPALLVEMAGVGDETGGHAEAMPRAAEILDGEIRLTLDRATAMILPLMTLVMGAIVAMIMMGIVTGILAANELAL